MPEPQLGRSVQRITQSGRVKAFSSRDDFVSYLHDTGVLNGDLEVLDPRWADFFQGWVQQGATGCRFAQHRAKHIDQAQYLSIAMPADLDAEVILALQDLLEGASDAQAVILFFPEAASTRDLATIVATLANSPYWHYVEVAPADPDDGHISIGLRWPVPRSRYTSEALAFSNLECMPFTRRSPVTAIALRTHPPAKVEEDGRVHLAQMPFFEIEERKREYFWERTRTEKLDLLNNELVHAARARVTCRLPISDWEAAQ